MLQHCLKVSVVELQSKRMILHGNKLFIMILRPTELLKLFSLCNKLYYNFNYYLFHSYSINNNYGKYDIHTPQPSVCRFQFLL